MSPVGLERTATRKDLTMKTSFQLMAAALVLALAGAAQAAQSIHSPTIFGAHIQDRAQCIVRNVGPTPLAVTVTIFNESGTAMPAGSTCGAPVTPGHNCSVFANIASGVAYGCTATVEGSAKNLRGTLILYDTVDPSDFEPVRSGELR